MNLDSSAHNGEAAARTGANDHSWNASTATPRPPRPSACSSAEEMPRPSWSSISRKPGAGLAE
jgi:hypothetical protein